MQLFFGSAGRLGRARFWPAMAVVVGAFWAYGRFVRGLAHSLSFWLVDLLLVFSACCLLSKRLHDRGRAGWWAAAVLLGAWLVWPAPRGVLGWAGVAVLVLAAVELGLRPGEPRPNRYGRPPA